MSHPSTSTPAQATTSNKTKIIRYRAKDHRQPKIYHFLGDDNWSPWKQDVQLHLRITGLIGYAQGTITCPDESSDQESYDNWVYNDMCAQEIIRERVEEQQKQVISNCDTARQMWTNLEKIHQPCGHRSIANLVRELHDHRPQEGDDIIAHLKAVQEIWDKIVLICPESSLPYTPQTFKQILAYSLPHTWDNFTERFELDPAKQNISVHTWIGMVNEEFQQRLKREGKTYETQYASTQKSGNTLLNRIGGSAASDTKDTDRCKYCWRPSHKSEDCWSLIKTKCKHCNKPGHPEKNCRMRRKQQKKKGKEALVAEALTEKSEAHTVEIDETDNEHLAAVESTSYSTVEPVFDNVYDSSYHYASSPFNKASRMYEWLADTGSTNHISNTCDIFSTYISANDAKVIGVGGMETKILGRGTINLTARYGDYVTSLTLEKVNYISTNKYNIISLGHWEIDGRSYHAENGKITLYNREKRPILEGKHLSSNLYTFNLQPIAIAKKPTYTFTATEPPQSWETWHRRFGHISYDGLKKLKRADLVDGFNVDTKSNMPDCPACIEGKHTIKSFPNKSTSMHRQKGELTHIDLWGKYDVISINGHQYYLLLVDDATRYVSLYFLKGKHEANTYIKYYLAHLHVKGITTHAIRVDRGTEFINKDLETWCQEKGMTIQKTAPYSPSQNRVTERMN